MKRLLRNKANHVVLEGFLSVLLEQDIKILHFLESERLRVGELSSGMGNKSDANDKYNRVDIMCEDADKRKMIIEVQNERQYGYLYRMLYGTSKVITDYMESGVMKTYYIDGKDDGLKEGYEKGMEKGMEKGKVDANLDNARRMKADGMPTELIAKYTGLTEEQINAL